MAEMYLLGNIDDFLHDHFNLLFGAAILWTALWMGYGLWRR
jgi:hypothetical protein